MPLSISLTIVLIYFHSLLLSSSLVEGAGEADWKIAEFIQLTGQAGNEMTTVLESAMKAEEKHEEMVRKVGKKTKYSRTNNLTEALAHNYMIKLSLEVAAGLTVENRASGYPNFFRDVCISLSSELSACTEPCGDLRYRTFTGCCNNLDNPEIGEKMTVPPPPLDVFYIDRKYQ